MASECRECSAALGVRNTNGLCRQCFCRQLGLSKKLPQKYCIDCGVPVSIQSRARCRPCGTRANNADERLKQARADGIRRKFQDPEHRAKMAKVSARNAQKAAADPEHRKWLVERGKELAKIAFRPEVRARNQSPETRARAAKKMSDRWFDWCPENLRDEYRHLVRSKRMCAADARKAIEVKIANLDALKHIPSALEYLRHYAPVAVLENGYRYGNAILTPAEVIERAKTRGWQPERWAA